METFLNQIENFDVTIKIMIDYYDMHQNPFAIQSIFLNRFF